MSSGIAFFMLAGMQHPPLRHWPTWLEPIEADAWLQQLIDEVPWKQEAITLFGKRHPLPRLTCWVADPGCGYRYSGLNNEIEAWTPLLSEIRQRVCGAANCPFNSLLLNYYRHGRDAMGWHADDEKELDRLAPIASLSLGAPRSLRFKPKRGREGDSLSLNLQHGDLLLMDPPTQEHWLHGLPRRLRLQQPRLNLTFRKVLAGN
jgi:alkylated DNA repair dioxygenase AlkB